ncbi:MAG: hypothetical protein L0Y55_04800 [Anaerolineales bacterium]|nr:hypothetical protein [Anaerolineales bacterium]
MTITSEQQAAFAKMLVHAAKQREVTMRVIGGVAVYAMCPSIKTRPKLQRAILDVDLIAARGDWNTLEGIFAENGLALRAKEKASWIFEKDGLTVELCDPNFGFADFTRRLALGAPTLPLTDLLLIKLARRPFEERDVQDTIALLLDHPVARKQAADQIDGAHIAQLCARDWKLFHAVYDNLVTLEKTLDQYLEPVEAQLVWRRIELLQSKLDRAPKSPGWMINQFLRQPTQVPR